MIATNHNLPLPAVYFPLVWPANELGRHAALLERMRAGVSDYWPTLAPLVELARVHGGVGTLRVTLVPNHAVAFERGPDGMWMAANAMAVWMRERPTPLALSLMSEAAQAHICTPPSECGVSVVLGVLDDATPPESTMVVERVESDRPHAEWLADQLQWNPNYGELPRVMMLWGAATGVAE